MGPHTIFNVILLGGLTLLSFIVQSSLKKKMDKYQKIAVGDGSLTGAQIAEKMLHDNGITDVKVQQTNGYLSDHYDPQKKVVNLSSEIYEGNNIAAAAVAAHECGHAVQHATSYGMLRLRSALVPATNFSARFAPYILLGGMGLLFASETLYYIVLPIIIIGLILFGISTIFSLVTLPVEIDASRRAIAWLDSTGIAVGKQKKQATSALKSAAYTYVVAALGSIAHLAYYIFQIFGRR